MGAIHHPDQPELPIVQQITCRRCRGVGQIYYVRIPADVVGGKRIKCPECAGLGRLDLAGQLFDHDITTPKKPLAKRATSRRAHAV
jgi:DnaJ-class molecular chaperone